MRAESHKKRPEMNNHDGFCEIELAWLYSIQRVTRTVRITGR